MENNSQDSKPDFENEEYTTPYIGEDASSYTNVYRNATIWMGSVEKTLAREICRKFNERVILQSENQLLKAENERLERLYLEDRNKNLNYAEESWDLKRKLVELESEVERLKGALNRRFQEDMNNIPKGSF